ncbi:MAG: caspase family protein [Deltaproteobacteria bacterium]|nr:caspase family protein [Deltaproteobacteria bacterium]
MRRLVVVALLLAGTPALAGELRVAVVVGNDSGGAGRTPLRFAERDAERMQAVLTDLGGVEEAHTLLGRDAGELAALLDRLQAHLASLDEPATVLFYYSGHADGRALLMNDTRFEFSELRAHLRRLPARLHVAILDACQTGAAARPKGAQVVPLVGVEVVEPSDLFQGGVFVTSSAPGELSHESDDIEASFFTHYLITGLRGAADVSGDGRVSLDEAYRFAYHGTVGRTQAGLSGTQHPTYDLDVQGRGQLVLTWLRDDLAYLVLPEGASGEFLIRGQGADGVVAEIAKAPARPVRVALPAGAYVVSKVRAGRYWAAEVEVEAGHSTTFDEASMQSRPLAVLAAKGGRAPAGRLEAAYRVTQGYLTDAGLQHGLRAAYSRRVGPVELGVVATWGHAAYAREDGIQVDLDQLGAGLLAQVRRPVLPWLALVGGAELQLAWVSQRGQLGGSSPEALRDLVLPLTLRAGAEVPLQDWLHLVLVGHLDLVGLRQAEGVTVRPTGGGELGVGVSL